MPSYVSSCGYPWRFAWKKRGALHHQRGVIGFIGMIVLCVLGLGALLQTSMLWLTVLKVGGGLYLIWLGIMLWRSEPITLANRGHSGSGSWTRFYQGLLSAVSNPKALLLFTAFITPFIDPRGDLVTQAAIMSVTYAVVEFGGELGVASAAHKVRPWLAQTGRRFNQVCGGFFVIFGVLIPAH